MSAQNFVGDVLGAMAEAFEPLTDALESPEAAAAFLGRLGWSLSPTMPADAFTTAFGPLPGALTRLAERAAELAALPQDADPLTVAAAIGKLGGAVADVVSKLSALGPPAQGPPPPLNDPAFWSSLAQDVPNLLIARYLSRRQPKLWGLLRFTGIATVDVQPATPTRGSYRRDTVHWGRVATLASDPGKLFAEVYGWGATFDDVRFLTSLGELCGCFGLPAGIGPAPSTALDPYWAPDAPARARILQLGIPLHRDIVEAGPSVVMLLAALAVVPVPPRALPGTSTEAPVGFAVSPMVSGDLTETIRITDALALSFTGGFEASGGIRVEIRPTGAGIATSAVTGRMEAAVRLDATPALPWLLFGARDSTRMELGAAHLALGVRGTPPDLDIDIEAAADRVALVVDFGEADGFLQKVLGGKPLRFDFGAGVGWSRSAGFRFIGQATLDVTLAVHLSILGVVDVESIQVVLGVQPGTGRAALTVALSGRLSLGPVRAVVERVGLRAELEARRPPAPPGNLGSADLAFRFKAPDGAGLSLDATAVRGGGYIRLDEAQGLYAGILQLEIQNRFTVTAIALITTKLPDGAPGFSLLVIIAAEFPGIQLGFGFTLNGLGGLLGANRTMSVDALRAGVRNHVLDSILFPKDPVANASQVIADVQAVFPVAPGRFVIGLMARLGWGTPTLISLDLGIILELPSPVRIALLGRLALALPEGEPVVSLKMDVVGILDFDRREASVDATIYDSRIAAFTISGDMAVRLNFGAAPAFALSAGGFNPRFTPPPGFPELRRMTIALADSDNPRLQLESYFATTPATVQFGARLDVFVAADAGIFGYFSVTGYLSFDALLVLAPPSFIVDMAGGLCLRRNGKVLFGIDIRLSLAGPTPWHAWGEATFEFIGKRTIPFDVTVGEEVAAVVRAVVDPLGDLLNALADPQNWTGALPAEAGLVTLRSLDPGAGTVVHPFGSLSVRQREVPLALTIDRYQNVELAAPALFDIASVTFGPTAVHAGADVREHFSAADYLPLTDDEKLSRPAFEPLPAGRSAIGFPAAPDTGEPRMPVAHGAPVARPDDTYDTVVIDEASAQPKQHLPDAYAAHPDLLAVFAAYAAGARSPLASPGSNRFAGDGLGIGVREPGYRLASRSTLAAVSDVTYASRAEAEEALRGSARPETLQVVGAQEVVS